MHWNDSVMGLTVTTISEKWPNFVHPGVLQRQFSWKCFNNMIFFICHPLQAIFIYYKQFAACSGWRWQWQIHAWKAQLCWSRSKTWDGLLLTMSPKPIFSYELRIVGLGVVQKAISTNGKPTIFCGAQWRQRKPFWMGTRWKQSYIRPPPPYSIVLAS